MTPEWQVLNEDCLDVLKRLPADCLDSMVSDPPAGIGFMGKEWDSDKGGRVSWIAWLEGIMREALRVLKPGAHALVWAIPRTSHWTATALEQAGFEIRDVVTHHFGTGFPKSLNVSKAIDEAAGATREAQGKRKYIDGRDNHSDGSNDLGRMNDDGWQGSDRIDTAPATDAAKQWNGWGTALKPASEHWILARKPLAGTVAANVQAHGTGALNIDACRIGTDETITNHSRSGDSAVSKGIYGDSAAQTTHQTAGQTLGRWPANLILSHSADCAQLESALGGCAQGCPVRELDGQSGNRPGSHDQAPASSGNSLFTGTGKYDGNGRNDSGGASRFFYVSKPSTAEREEGLAHLPKKKGAEITDRAEGSVGIQNARAGAGRTSAGRANHHPTVKSVTLMSYLVKLITPPGGIVLDPFTGSGGTGIAAVIGGWSFLGIEKDPEFTQIARGRIAHWQAQHTKTSP